MAYNTNTNMNRRFGSTQRILQDAFKQGSPERSATTGVDSQKKGMAELTKLMNPYMNYFGGSDLASERAAAPQTSKLNDIFMKLQNAKAMAEGRQYDIGNVARRRDDLFKDFRLKSEMGRNLKRAKKDYAFKGQQNELNRLSQIKTTKDKLNFIKEQARKEKENAIGGTMGGLWSDMLAMIPAVIAGIYSGPAGGSAAFTGARAINRKIGGID